jgi:hypothetical protein
MLHDLGSQKHLRDAWSCCSEKTNDHQVTEFFVWKSKTISVIFGFDSHKSTFLIFSFSRLIDTRILITAIDNRASGEKRWLSLTMFWLRAQSLDCSSRFKVHSLRRVRHARSRVARYRKDESII